MVDETIERRIALEEMAGSLMLVAESWWRSGTKDFPSLLPMWEVGQMVEPMDRAAYFLA